MVVPFPPFGRRCLPSPPLGGATFPLSPVGWCRPLLLLRLGAVAFPLTPVGCRHPSWGGVAFAPLLLGGVASLPPPSGGVVFDSLLWAVLCFFLFPCEWCGFPQWCVSSPIWSGAASCFSGKQHHPKKVEERQHDHKEEEDEAKQLHA